MEQDNPVSAVAAKQGKDATVDAHRGLGWAEASIWTDRMVSALGNGVRGDRHAFFGRLGLFTLQAALIDARHSR